MVDCDAERSRSWSVFCDDNGGDANSQNSADQIEAIEQERGANGGGETLPSAPL